jgi:hypothetical protein
MSRFHVVIGIGACSVVHFGTMAVSMFVAMSFGMDRFEFGGDPSVFETIIHAIASVLIFPGFYLYSAFRDSK